MLRRSGSPQFKILRMEGKLPEITDEPPEPDNGGSDRLTLVE